MILQLNDFLGNQDCIFVVGGNWELWNFNPSLFQIDNALKVKPDLFNSLSSLLLSNSLCLVLLINILILSLEIDHVLLNLLDLVLKTCFILVHKNTDLPLTDKLFPVIIS